MAEIEFVSRYKYQDGESVYVVPVDRNSRGELWPRCPVGGWSAYYNANKSQAVLVASKTASSYLDRRGYARKIGVVRFAWNGNIEAGLRQIGFGR